MRRPKIIVLLLAGGVLLLAVGGVMAASLPPRPSHQPASAAAAHRSAGTATRGTLATRDQAGATAAQRKSSDSSARKKHQVKRSITYTVKPGDNLSGIAEWFKLQGYGALYNANRAVIGSDPNFIFPGERIAITNGKMTLSGTRS